MLTEKQLARMLGSVKSLGEILREWRDQHGYNDTEAAAFCGLSRQHWWMLINDERFALRDATLSKLLRTGIPAERLELAAAITRQRKRGPLANAAPAVSA